MVMLMSVSTMIMPFVPVICMRMAVIMVIVTMFAAAHVLGYGDRVIPTVFLWNERGGCVTQAGNALLDRIAAGLALVERQSHRLGHYRELDVGDAR
jgi:hypothetical protein